MILEFYLVSPVFSVSGNDAWCEVKSRETLVVGDLD
jgi:hypothetical protein